MIFRVPLAAFLISESRWRIVATTSRSICNFSDSFLESRFLRFQDTSGVPAGF